MKYGKGHAVRTPQGNGRIIDDGERHSYIKLFVGGEVVRCRNDELSGVFENLRRASAEEMRNIPPGTTILDI